MKGYTPLIYVSRNGNINLAKKFIDYGANVDHIDLSGSTFINFIEDEDMKEELRLYSSCSQNIKPARRK